jgi:hypothetical protein
MELKSSVQVTYCCVGHAAHVSGMKKKHTFRLKNLKRQFEIRRRRTKDNIKMNLKEIDLDFVAGCLNAVRIVIRVVIVGSNPTAGMEVCLL